MTEEKAGVEPRNDHRWFAGFICLIGYFLLIVAITQAVWAKGATAPGQSLFGANWLSVWLGIAGIGVLLAFVGLHLGGEGGETRNHLWYRALASLRSQRASAIIVGLILIAAAVYALVGAARATSSVAPPPTQFALTVPMGSFEQDPPQPRPGPAQAAPSDEPAVVFWNVPAASLPVNPGLLPMAIAASLIMVFGLLYPQIASSGDEEGKGFVQKLVVPGLGLILFGVGASQQASAQEGRENVRLVAQNLPPVFEVPRSERRAYVLKAGDTSTATTQQIEASLAALLEQIQDRDSTLTLNAEDRLALVDQVDNVREEIREGTRLTDARTSLRVRQIRQDLRDGFDGSQDAMARVADAVQSSSASLVNSVAALRDDERATFCAVLRTELAAANTHSGIALALVDRREARDRENLFRKAWLSTVGRDPKLGKAFRDRIASRPATAAQEIGEAEAFCRSAYPRG